MAVGDIERKTQNRVVKLFTEQLGYEYLGNWHDERRKSPIEEDRLTAWLKESGYSDTLISKALYELRKTATDQSKSLYDVNKAVYSYLRYGIQIKEEVGENHKPVNLVNWDEPEKNHFGLAEEVTIVGEHTKRPDVVLYVNGIALGILELKRSTVSVSTGIRQNLDNQKSIFIRPFFTTMQLVMAGNDTEGLRYGAIDTPEKYYLTWKEPGETGLSLDQHLRQFCNKERFLEIIHNFTVFDSGTKKLCRHNQYFGVRAAQEYVKQSQGGIIWHAQGSGKSLTMVWLTKWIYENITDGRVLILTDRTELDEQIEGVYLGVQEQIHRTKSGKDLIDCLNAKTPWLMCSLVHKFGGKEEKDESSNTDYDKFIEEMKNAIPKDFSPKGDIYVFVDECHRTQSGKLHEAMKAIIPNALLIGFTGTPLLKKDKKKSIEVFGPYIHTYKFDEAVEDGVVLDLRYEARKIDQHLTSQDKVDKWFDSKTKGLTDVARTELKKRWGTMQKVLSSKDRLAKIVADIMFDMGTKDRLQSGRGNAMLVSGSIYQACKFYEMFQNQGLTKCAIITSYVPTVSDIKGEATGEGLTEKLRKYEIYEKMLGEETAEDFEKRVKKQFVDQPGQMKLLIVVDKLLTGFDAPSATYLYIDKSMRDHGLFQAICRVNRLDEEDKEYGYIIDYKDLFRSLEAAVGDYTSEAFEDYEAEDVKGLLKDRLQMAREHLEDSLESVRALCEPVAPLRDTMAYIRYFCGQSIGYEAEKQEYEQKRQTLYKLTSSLVRAYADLANEMDKAGYSEDEAKRIYDEVRISDH